MAITSPKRDHNTQRQTEKDIERKRVREKKKRHIGRHRGIQRDRGRKTEVERKRAK